MVLPFKRRNQRALSKVILPRDAPHVEPPQDASLVISRYTAFPLSII
ncbi:hypothetical protein BJB45_14120 [Halomonas huangheensis]|uniref:Uncharacterized protein n=1 Tax=Halomonas huangheensis TaxID=1178482 RepID=W1N748_9GAMM|nr:hypothetical protein BJB45_14120 [Halomonas huangheensis]